MARILGVPLHPLSALASIPLFQLEGSRRETVIFSCKFTDKVNDWHCSWMFTTRVAWDAWYSSNKTLTVTMCHNLIFEPSMFSACYSISSCKDQGEQTNAITTWGMEKEREVNHWNSNRGFQILALFSPFNSNVRKWKKYIDILLWCWC